MRTVKHYGGIVNVQDPLDAEVPSMPGNAMREVDVDYSIPVTELAGLLTRLSKEKLKTNGVMKDEKTKTEIQIATEERALEKGVMNLGELSPFTSPNAMVCYQRYRMANSQDTLPYRACLFCSHIAFIHIRKN